MEPIRLQDTSVDEVEPRTIREIAASLGVDCAFCHVQGKMDLDDKPPKKTARDMMAMTAAIRKVLWESPREFDPRKYLGTARGKVKELVRHKVRDVLCCAGHAFD